MANNLEVLDRLSKEFGLKAENNDFFTINKGKRTFTIITREGIEKIQYKAKIDVRFEVVRAEKDYAAVKAYGKKEDRVKEIQTFASASKGEVVEEDVPGPAGTIIKSAKLVGGSTASHYVLEVAEKRALSRIVLKVTGLYAETVFSEDENQEEFNEGKTKESKQEELGKQVAESVIPKMPAEKKAAKKQSKIDAMVAAAVPAEEPKTDESTPATPE